MRKVIVLEHISLDGVIQAPGGPDEDTSGGFAYGGWIALYSDAILGAITIWLPRSSKVGKRRLKYYVISQCARHLDVGTRRSQPTGLRLSRVAR